MTNFELPFNITAQGTIATTSDPNEIATDRVNALIGTYPGERVMQSDYGVNTNAYLFTPDIIEETDLLATEIKTAISNWEPSITVSSVTPVTTQTQSGVEEVNVEFTISSDPTFQPTMTATVLVGGTVVSN